MNTKLNERQREAASFEKSTVVVASAGTGKTTTLAATYIGLLERGLNPSEVLAITFTEKAAGEMRERIRRELLKKADRPDSDARWRKILNEISQAPISTIHSFCGQMIREHAVRLGIDPRFQILDETRSEDRLDRAVWSVLNERIRRDDQAVFSLVRLYDFEGAAKRGVVDLLKRLVKGLNDLGIFLSKPMCEGQGSWGGACRAAREREAAEIGGRFKAGVERLREAFDRIFRTERAAGKRGEDYLKLVHEKEEEIREALRNISTEASPEAARAFEFLSDFAKPGKLAERDENLPLIESLAQIKELLGKDSLLMSWFGLIKSLPASLMIEGLAREVQDRYQEEKEGEILDFTDLLFLARRLLRENVAARRNFQRRYKALLVDEFQDTDSVQAEIILLLGEADGAAERIDPGRSSWEVIRKVPLDPRKLFIVGDAKQSIYGFRGADIAVFRAVAQKITSLGHPPVALQENYRTVPELIDFTNRFFSSLLPSPGELSSEDDLRQYRTTFSDEDHLRPPKEGGTPPREPAQIILLTAESEEDSDTARWREAGAVAHLIRRWRSEGVLKNYKEAAILFRSRGEIGPYREALKRFGLPHYLVKAGRFFEQIEIVEMIGLLSFLRDPGDDLALARLMTSAMGGFSFGELAELTVRSAGPTLLGKIRKPPSFALPELAEKARRLAALIEELLSLRDRRHPHEILQAALDKTRYDAVLAALEDGELRVANIGKLIDLARSLSREGIAGLDDCIERICTMAQSVSQEPEASPYGEDEDVVRLMTVHQAKGLEFETVIVPNLGGSPNRGTDNTLIDPTSGILC
ncbi:MAG TPA: UvrD-helicase domain-containing protein, partial [Nitrospiria bacterium]|nr:UvrD-helicase domain-containing protein [Nitrospiria bacterium]